MSELETLGGCIRYLLKKKGITAEDLVAYINDTGLLVTNKPAISRMMTGKKLPNELESQALSEILGAPELAEAIFQLNKYRESNDESHALAFYERIDLIVRDQKDSHYIDSELLFRMLNGLHTHSLEQDVSLQVKDNFSGKLKTINGAGQFVQKLKAMYKSYLYDLTVDRNIRAWMAAALLYFISPFDLIPDFTLPLGYMDDGVVIQFVYNKFLQK